MCIRDSSPPLRNADEIVAFAASVRAPLFSRVRAGSLYWSKSMQRAYNDRHAGQPNKVQLNDAIFALHATFVSFLTLAQVRGWRARRWTQFSAGG